jgi:hypothetical protein
MLLVPDVEHRIEAVGRNGSLRETQKRRHDARVQFAQNICLNIEQGDVRLTAAERFVDI